MKKKSVRNGVMHKQLVKLIEDKLKADGEEIVSSNSWIRGPTIPDIVSYSEPPTSSHPLLKIIEVKTKDKKDLQRALYQLLAARESIAKPPKDMYALFFVAISQRLYDKLIRTNELDLFLKIWSGPLTETTLIDQTGKYIKRETTTLGLGVILVNDKNEIEYLTEFHPSKV